MSNSFYWHDYETFGTDPRRDRPAQFAGQRTDEDLNPVGAPLMIHCRPSDDYLPQPEACLLTGITPAVALRQGLPETEFIGLIEAELGRPGTCGVGYNSIRFDDEVTRNTLYRNLRDPYAREWRNGNSRWDLIDLARMAYALRPQGVNWPIDDEGLPSFRLELLTRANGIEHGQAHDALADVNATIAFARVLRRAQPKLFDWYYGLRRKAAAQRLLDPAQPRPLLHVSGMYPRDRACLAPVLPLAVHPVNANEYVVIDLRVPPDEVLDADAETLQRRLYQPSAELQPGQERLPLKTVHANRSPALAPMNTLTEEAAGRAGIDAALVERHAAALLARMPALRDKLARVFTRADLPAEQDPDLAIYSGGFFSDHDRRLMQEVVAAPPDRLAEWRPAFSDPRLEEMLFRYRARNYPQTLDGQDQARWQAFRCGRLTGDAESGFGISAFGAELQRLREQSEGGKSAILDELEMYAADLVASCTR